jgi:hypothetical protein
MTTDSDTSPRDTACNVHRASPIKGIEGKYIEARRDRNTVLSNPTVTMVKCHVLVSCVPTRAFVITGVRDARAGILNIRDRVRGATHLLRSRKAENWDIMTVGMKGDRWGRMWMDKPTARQRRGRSSLCECLAWGCAAAREV